MLIFTANDGTNNIVQFVIGPETNFQMDMMGSIKLDLGKLLDQFDNKLPLKMVITSSNDESKTYQMLSATNGVPPFPPAFFKSEKSMDEQPYIGPMMTEVNEEGNAFDCAYNDPRGQYVDDIKCPGCKTMGVYLKKQMPPYCADCLKIELGLGNIEVPVPEEEVVADKPITKKKPRKLSPRKKKPE